MTRTRRLSEVELRVAGALMEKEQTTPDAYPLTVNALRAACNQKTNRDPVTSYGEEAVRDALETLRQDVLVWRSSGARADRWEHRLSSRWQLNAEAKAILTLLMLRGPQTPGELRTRSERMCSFASLDDVHQALSEMSQGDHPLVRVLPRAPGQGAQRWCHRVGKDEIATASTVAPGESVAEASFEARPGSVERTYGTEALSASSDAKLEALARAVESLATRVEQLEELLTATDDNSEGESSA